MYDDNNSEDIIQVEENSDKKFKNGRNKSNVWKYFNSNSIIKNGHTECVCKGCGWKRKVGKAHEMVDHIALHCPKADADVKSTFLEEIKNRMLPKSNQSLIGCNEKQSKRLKSSNQPKLTSMFDSSKIDGAKEQRCNQALTRFVVCCGIPLQIVSNPFFVDFIKNLCPGYKLPDRITFSNSWINQELANVTSIILQEIISSDNITLGLDGWSDSSGRSIYAFVLTLSSKKEYLYSLEDLSLHSHTADYIAQKILGVIEEIGPEKISSIVSDNASSMVAAKKLVNQQYNHIIPIRCIAHHINLLTTDIMKHPFSKRIIKNCMKLVTYFRKSHQAGSMLSKDIVENVISGGSLKGYSKTRWTTAWQCLTSIQRCESSLRNIFEKNPEILNDSIKNLLGNRFFFQDVEEIIKIIQPVKEAIVALEFKTTSLTDCFVQLIKLGIAVKNYSSIIDSSFRFFCIEKFNKRWKQFDFKVYLLGYFFHPLYRGKGLKLDIFRQICHIAIGFWIGMGGGKNSANRLVAQLSAYKNYAKPYEFEFVDDLYSAESWWKMIEQKENWIQKLALKILSITPHNVGCERLFSVIGWMSSKRRKRLSIERLQAMAKLHMYYVANASTQTNYVYTDVGDDKFYEELNQSLNDEIDFSNEEIEDLEIELDGLSEFDDENEGGGREEGEDLDEDSQEVTGVGNEIIIENYLDLTDQELKRVLEVEVRVVIEEELSYDHGSSDFDINEVLNSNIE